VVPGTNIFNIRIVIDREADEDLTKLYKEVLTTRYGLKLD
jgi:hypothetical protein